MSSRLWASGSKREQVATGWKASEGESEGIWSSKRKGWHAKRGGGSGGRKGRMEGGR